MTKVTKTTEGKITLIKLAKGYIIHLEEPLGFSSEIALTNKELEDLKKLLIWAD